MSDLALSFEEVARRTIGGDIVWAVRSIFSTRTIDGDRARYEPASAVVITTNGICWTYWVIEYTGTFRKKAIRREELDSEPLEGLRRRDCHFGFELGAGNRSGGYYMLCGGRFLTGMAPILQEAVDALRGLGVELERRHDIPVR